MNNQKEENKDSVEKPIKNLSNSNVQKGTNLEKDNKSKWSQIFAWLGLIASVVTILFSIPGITNTIINIVPDYIPISGANNLLEI
jgi:hypothetical protein